MALMDSPHPRGDKSIRDRAGERADQARVNRQSSKPLVSLTAKITAVELEEFKRRIAPQKATPAITEMVRAFLAKGAP